MTIWLMVVAVLAVFAGMVGWDSTRKRNTQTAATTRKRGKSTAALQEFLPITGFHSSGPMIVRGRFRQMIRVGDKNLYSMSLDEIILMRDRFKDLVKRLDHPFQISVQARRANYTDFVRYSEDVVRKTAKEYDIPAFSSYAKSLGMYLKEESQKPRTDRENMIVVGVLPKMTGEEEQSQLERLARECSFVESGLSHMDLPHQVLGAIDSIEALQNFYNRERAMSQRYRDAYYRHTHAPQVDGEEVEAKDIAPMAKEA